MYQAKIESTGNQKYHATTKDSHFEMGSNGSGSNPVDALLASLCACLGHYVGGYLLQEKITFSEYVVSANSELTKDKSRLADIHIVIEVKDAVWDEIKKSEILNFVTKCHIYNTLKTNSKIIFEGVK